jgi:hypothetical protein
MTENERFRLIFDKSGSINSDKGEGVRVGGGGMMATEPVFVNVYGAQESKESISPDYVACRASTTNRVVVPASQPENRFMGSIKGLQIRALVTQQVTLDAQLNF